MTRTALFSKDRVHRYLLGRVWNPDLPAFMGIGLNPSIADENQDDRTIKRLIAFAFREKCGSLIMTNIFAYVSTFPVNMRRASDPIGPENDHYIIESAKKAKVVVACWGVHGEFMRRGNAVQEMIPGLKCFGLTSGGYPKHPLYLPGDEKIVSLAAAQKNFD